MQSVTVVHQNLANRVIDGIAIGASGIATFKLQEPASYPTTWLPISGAPFVLLMNQGVYDSLSAKEKGWVAAAADAALSVGGGAGVALAVLVGFTVVAVFWRYALNDPIFGVEDVSTMALTIVVSAAIVAPGFGTLLVLLFIRVPVGLAMLLVSVPGIALIRPAAVAPVLAGEIFAVSSNYSIRRPEVAALVPMHFEYHGGSSA